MDGKRLIRSLEMKQFLSYGLSGSDIELLPLNVLVGQNASGKSNFLQIIELLRAAPTNLASLMYEGGGVAEYLYKGMNTGRAAIIVADVIDRQRGIRLLHSLHFTVSAGGQHLVILYEAISDLSAGGATAGAMKYYEYEQGSATIVVYPFTQGQNGDTGGPIGEKRLLNDIRADASILSQRYDPDAYPALAFLAQQYGAIKIYRDFNLSGLNSLRVAQRPDLPNDFLEEDGRNLSLILNDLHHRGVMPTLVEKMKAVYEDVEDITVKVGGGVVQTFIRERGMSSPIPAARLSDGTLRYLCLLAILYHPEPPPLVCFEEPEIGMHPDLIATIAEMLLEASQRMQIIVTTHSDILVSALSAVPEAVIVCERTEDGSQLRRLEREPLEKWLQDYSLGELWRTGEIGGVRY